MRLSRDCRFWFFTAWTAWLFGGWSLVSAGFLLRGADSLSFYAVDAWLAMLMPMASFGFADLLVMRLYESMWRRFNRDALGPVVLERESVDRLREDLRKSLILRWLSPPVSRSIGAQLMTAALWLPALAAPEGTPWLKRYREWLVDALCLTVLFPLALLAFAWLRYPWNLGVALLIAAVALLTLGYSLLRLSARRQAILDYFDAWKGSGN